MAVKKETHVLYLIELTEGSVFSFDVQHMWDMDKVTNVDGTPLGSVEVVMLESGEIEFRPIGYVGLMLEA